MDAYFDARAGLRDVLVAAMVAALVIAVALLVARATPAASRWGLARVPGLFATDTESEAGHIVMLGAMIAMVTTGITMLAWRFVFGALAGAYVVLLLARVGGWLSASARSGTSERAAASVYHLLAALAMLDTTFASSSSGSGGHAMEMGDGAGTLPAPFFGWIAVLLFAADALVTLLVAARRRLPGAGDVRLPATVRLVVAPHVVMDGAMIVMLAIVL